MHRWSMAFPQGRHPALARHGGALIAMRHHRSFTTLCPYLLRPFPISIGGGPTIPVQIGHRHQESFAEAPSAGPPSQAEEALGTGFEDLTGPAPDRNGRPPDGHRCGRASRRRLSAVGTLVRREPMAGIARSIINRLKSTRSRSGSARPRCGIRRGCGSPSRWPCGSAPASAAETPEPPGRRGRTPRRGHRRGTDAGHSETVRHVQPGGSPEVGRVAGHVTRGQAGQPAVEEVLGQPGGVARHLGVLPDQRLADGTHPRGHPYLLPQCKQPGRHTSLDCASFHQN